MVLDLTLKNNEENRNSLKVKGFIQKQFVPIKNIEIRKRKIAINSNH